jgi:hypothetical protein
MTGRSLWWILVVGPAACVVLSRTPGLSQATATGGKPLEVRWPEPDIGVDSLAARRQAQLQTVGQFQVFHDFRFTDKLKESGIPFVYHIVNDVAQLSHNSLTTLQRLPSHPDPATFVHDSNTPDSCDSDRRRILHSDPGTDTRRNSLHRTPKRR